MSAIEKTTAFWYSRDEKPAHSGWHPVINFDGSPSYRLFEENVWWCFTYIECDGVVEESGWELVPNNSFSYWARVEPMMIVREQIKGAA